MPLLMCCLHYKLSTLIIIQLRLNNQTVIKKVWNCTLDTVLKTFTYVITHDGHHIHTFPLLMNLIQRSSNRLARKMCLKAHINLCMIQPSFSFRNTESKNRQPEGGTHFDFSFIVTGRFHWSWGFIFMRVFTIPKRNKRNGNE